MCTLPGCFVNETDAHECIYNSAREDMISLKTKFDTKDCCSRNYRNWSQTNLTDQMDFSQWYCYGLLKKLQNQRLCLLYLKHHIVREYYPPTGNVPTHLEERWSYVNYYRPASPTSFLCKIMELIISDVMVSHTFRVTI